MQVLINKEYREPYHQQSILAPLHAIIQRHVIPSVAGVVAAVATMLLTEPIMVLDLTIIVHTDTFAGTSVIIYDPMMLASNNKISTTWYTLHTS